MDEWRLLRENHPTEGGLTWLEDEERLRELEVALVGEHGLTNASRYRPLGQPEPEDAGTLAYADAGEGAQGAGAGADQAAVSAESDPWRVAELGFGR